MALRKPNFTTLFLILAAVLFSGANAEAGLSHADASEVWAQVAMATELTALPFEIKEEKTPNAWVTNGKSVTVTTGLLNLLEMKTELYGVFAHEAGHAKLKHYEGTVSKNVGLSIVAAILSNVLGSNLGDVAVGVGANLVAAGWSREQEVEADDYAVKLAYNNGEDPVGFYSALQRISSSGGKTQPSGFNSHPPDDRRLFHVKNEILKYQPDAQFPELVEEAEPDGQIADPEEKSEPYGQIADPEEKSEPDGQIADLAKKAEPNAQSADPVEKTDLDAQLADLVEKTKLDVQTCDPVEKAELDAQFADLVEKAGLGKNSAGSGKGEEPSATPSEGK